MDVSAVPGKIENRHLVHLVAFEVIDNYVAQDEFAQLATLGKSLNNPRIGYPFIEVPKMHEVGGPGTRIKDKIPHVFVAIGVGRANPLNKAREQLVVLDVQSGHTADSGDHRGPQESQETLLAG